MAALHILAPFQVDETKGERTCRAGPGVRRVLCRFLSTTTFDQQGYPICWLVSVIWLLDLLPFGDVALGNQDWEVLKHRQ